jgi:hypothetical protein
MVIEVSVIGQSICLKKGAFSRVDMDKTLAVGTKKQFWIRYFFNILRRYGDLNVFIALKGINIVELILEK